MRAFSGAKFPRTIDPILNLGIDNCFASKHWILPEQWCELIAGLGLRYIEASADTECDPLGMSSVGVEQMYASHQPPWTITGAKEMLRRIYAIGGASFYLTDDVGHMNGQQFFLRPTEESILRDLAAVRTNSAHKRVWMGSRRAMQAFRSACTGELADTQAVHTILMEAEQYPYLFAEPHDGSPYTWLEETGCWSPIIHLQQSDGKSSPHWPFDKGHNEKGIIHGEQLLRALEKAYTQEMPSNLPPACQRITLTLEPFIGTAGNIYDAVDELRDSVAYWRRFIPKDGMRLSELIARLPAV